MEITRKNYEAYFIDYLEGNLDTRLVDDFIEFLQQNPDLKEELALFETVSVKPESVSFHKKENLYKEKYDSEKEFNKAAIASLEGDLSENEKTEFDNYILTHPEKQKEVTLFSKTKLQADETIVFSKKKKLYRYSLGRTILFWSGRVAAILILGFAIFSLLDYNSPEIIQNNQVAEVKEKTPKKEKTVETNNIPTETKKKEPVKTQKVSPKPVIKKIEPKQKSNKSLREDNRGRLEHEDIAMIRIPLDVPSELSRITASVDFEQATISLATMKTINPQNQNTLNEERLLADIVREKTKFNKINFNKVTQAGLNLVSNFTKENFSYATNEEGKVTEYNYDSRLFAFSIPTKNETVGD